MHFYRFPSHEAGYRLIFILIILQMGHGKHHIFCTAKSRSTNKGGLKQLMDDLEEELRPLQIYTSNYFRMRDGHDVEELYGSTNQSLDDQLPSTCGLDIIRNDIKQWKKENKSPFEYDFEESSYIEEKDNYLETSETNEDDITYKTCQTIDEYEDLETAETEYIEMNDRLTTTKKLRPKTKIEKIDEEIKIYEEAAAFRKRLQEIKLKQTSVKNLEKMAKNTLRRVAKIRVLARYKLRKLDQAKNAYLKKLKSLLKKIKGGFY
ncbi:uncharacterized protein [Halyomorpha halys]|uniref:uncharacterized protein n=1 Tax=Halyomorpha halys TaxID=286706 RepID=UPI0006D4F964|nr:uncharacterized protein LOC106692622 [Halyomorpha halys]